MEEDLGVNFERLSEEEILLLDATLSLRRGLPSLGGPPIMGGSGENKESHSGRGGYRWSGKGREGIGRPRLELPIEEIRRLYVEEGLSSVQIAVKYGCGKSTIISRLREMGVERSWRRSR